MNRDTEGRVLTCVKCQTPVRVFEEPREHIDPDRFVCGACLSGAEQLTIAPTETRRYDPSTAAIPF